MSGLKESGVESRNFVHRKTVFSLLVLAALLFLVSAILQLNASIQRWVTFTNSQAPTSLSVEDNLYDYFVPSDPWVPIGTAAELLGIGLLLIALGFALMAAAVFLVPSTRPKSNARAAILWGILDLSFIILATAGFATMGWDNLQAGLSGSAPVLTEPDSLTIGLFLGYLLALITMIAPIVLAIRWHERLVPASISSLLLFGCTLIGYLIASFFIAPLFFGTSSDTTRWSEAVVAISTGAAAFATAYGAFTVLSLRAHPKKHTSN